MDALKTATLALALALTPAAHAAGKGKTQAGPDPKIQALAAKFIEQSFLPGEGQDLSRLQQDDTLKACNQYRDQPPEKVAAEINARERATIKYPEGGKLMGDWKNGEKLYAAGFGMRIGRIEPDRPERQKGGNGGNCYACHAADPKEVAFGTIGPSLMHYGKLRGASEEMVKYTYEKIYNPQAYTACSQMPRMGHNGILRPEQIADIVAYLLSPESPVNK
ncbi:MAG: sulfur oxidation c-type cytochrome SoxX [Thiobacillaceae bacterium]|nr:sulfur oxidation c-type cytochrome SoxX [Thiobacillaceae bacterium]MCX7673580.1 sulfur oxidation c-type cytochrome SoxX [Thiobacillaceae bacterium]MDW8322625.1 sulfur oxidation c-type cytochrome SoxX [Burkholderiales bacterium]